MKRLLAMMVFVLALPVTVRAESCITTGGASTSQVATSIGSFFQIGGSDVVRVANPPGVVSTPISFGKASAFTGLGCGSGAQATGPGAVAVGPNAKALNKNSVAVGQGATAVAADSVALGSNSIATRNNTVSVGSPGFGRQITNVVPGTALTDAVNVSQLQNVANQFMGVTNDLQNQINQSRKEYRAGISMAMAAAALQTGAGAAGPGKIAIGLGGGAFGGTASLSAGIAYSPTRRLNFNAGVSVAPVVGMVGVFGGTTWTLN